MPDVPQRPFYIRVFVPTGDSEGLRIVEKSNWSGVGVVFNRTNYKEVISRKETDKIGVYILKGTKEDNVLPTVYVGEGDPVKDRLVRHYSQKEFWERGLFFVAKDDSLNKAHVQYLEAELLRMAAAAKQCILDNTVKPNSPSLAEAETALVDGFLQDILSILPLLDFGVFEKVGTQPTKDLLVIETKTIKATGYEHPGGFVVVKGSQLSKQEASSLHNSHRSLRSDLLSQSAITDRGDFYELLQDYLFQSPSAAACFILGYSVNGRDAWKDKSGATLKEIQAAQAAATLKADDAEGA